MKKYFLKKLLFMIPVIIGSTVIIFLILHLSPGDPVDMIVGPNVTPEVYQNIRISLGLDKPLVTQYFIFLGKLLRGDLGQSILQKRPVLDIVLERFPVTLKIGVFSLILSFIIAVPMGIIAAIKRNTAADYMSMSFALLGISMPTFWFGLILLYFFAYKYRIFPLSGYETWRHYVLPVITVGLTDAAVTARMMRSSMLEVIRQDYIRTARAKGVRETVVMAKHALKNAILPVITLLGMRIGWIFAGSAVIEIVFSMPGIGRLMVDAIFARDYPIIQGSMLILVISITLGNMLADFLYALVDPRIKY
ncbi:MAG TPA: ABC transporter permease [Oscillospiraceae bacterium]|nr:ABC transporter permease [Oscillospiraceae bacterium]